MKSTVALLARIAQAARPTPIQAHHIDASDRARLARGRLNPFIVVTDRKALLKQKVNTSARATPWRVRPW